MLTSISNTRCPLAFLVNFTIVSILKVIECPPNSSPQGDKNSNPTPNQKDNPNTNVKPKVTTRWFTLRLRDVTCISGDGELAGP